MYDIAQEPYQKMRKGRGLLERLVGGEPDLTLAELQGRLQQRCGIRVGLSTLHGTLRRLGFWQTRSGSEPSLTTLLAGQVALGQRRDFLLAEALDHRQAAGIGIAS